jgi:N-acetylglutamate synthase-like GNAT family acetyltransferase
MSEGTDGSVIAAANFAPERFSDRMWNLYFIAVNPSHQGKGIGGALLDHIEAHLRSVGPHVAQVLIVETSSTDQYARTRGFTRSRATSRRLESAGSTDLTITRSSSGSPSPPDERRAITGDKRRPSQRPLPCPKGRA